MSGEVAKIGLAKTVSPSNGPTGKRGVFKEHGLVITVLGSVTGVIISIAIAAVLLSGQIGRIENRLVGQIRGAEDRLAERIDRIESRVEKIEDGLAATREELSYIRGSIDIGSLP